MQKVRVLLVMLAVLVVTMPACADETTIESLLRAQVFNKAFEGFDFYHVAIEADQSLGDGSREVTAVASGKFLDHVQRLKVLFLIIGEQVVAGQVLEGKGVPPCITSSGNHSAPL